MSAEDLNSCRACEGALESHRYMVREMMFGTRTEYAYSICSGCGALNLRDKVDFEDSYPQNYYAHRPPNERKHNSFLRKVDRSAHILALNGHPILAACVKQFRPVQDIASLANQPRNDQMRVLDIGCGDGGFMHDVSLLTNWVFLGIDPYAPDDSEIAPNVNIKKLRLSECEGNWDIITSNHCLEHVDEQNDFFRDVHRLLSRNGIAIIRIPVFGNYAWRKFKVNWVQLDAPRHVILHTAQSFTRLAEQNGLKIAKVLYDSTDFQFLGSMRYVRNEPLAIEKRTFLYKLSGFLRILKRGIYYFRSLALNAKEDGDQAVFYLRRNECSRLE